VAQRAPVYLGSFADGRRVLLLEKAAAAICQTAALEAKARKQLHGNQA